MANENTIQATGTFITRKGLNLITKLVAAKGTLSFSRAAVGTGKPPEGYSPDSMISLSSYKMDAEIADYGTQEDKAYVTMQVSSDQVEEGFLLTEVGLYATDPDEGEILYAYMDISTDPTYIYANGSANRTKYAEFTLYVLIGTVEKVTAAVTPGSIITKETFKASNLPVIDTHGIMGDSGSTVMSQELFDAVAEKIVNELVSNEKLNTVLTEKLADYIMKSKIVNHLLATDESTVLSGPMGKELKGLLDVLNTKALKLYNYSNNADQVSADGYTGKTLEQYARFIRDNRGYRENFSFVTTPTLSTELPVEINATYVCRVNMIYIQGDDYRCQLIPLWSNNADTYYCSMNLYSDKISGWIKK